MDISQLLSIPPEISDTFDEDDCQAVWSSMEEYLKKLVHRVTTFKKNKEMEEEVPDQVYCHALDVFLHKTIHEAMPVRPATVTKAGQPIT